MGLLSLSLPTIGQANSSEDQKVINAFTAIQNEYNANIPNILGGWKTFYHASGVMAGSTTVGVYGFHQSGLQAAAGVYGGVPPALQMQYVDPADYAISGYTTQIRLRILTVTNSTAPTCTFTAGWASGVAAGGAIGVINITLAAASISAAVVTPGANSTTTATSSTLTMPAAALFFPIVTTSVATTAANSTTGVTVQIQYRYI